MLTEMTLGQFMPGASLLHRMDPRVKIILLFLYVVAIFLMDGHGSYALMTAVTLGLILMSGLSVIMILKSVRPIMWIILFTFIIHLFSTPGEEIAKILAFTMTWEGLDRGFLISLRLILLITASSLLMYTTSPLALTDALEDILKPLKKVGFPAHGLAMMMTIALRFIPTLIEETDKIMKAQQCRGTDFSSGSIIRRAKMLVPILVPLFISAFRRADDLAIAMEARCYRGGTGRTRMKRLKVGKLDYYCIACFAVLLSGLAALTYLGI